MRSVRLTRPMMLRLVADVIMVNAALVLSLSLRYLWLVGAEDNALPRRKIIVEYAHMYAGSAWVLTLICVTVFSAGGFYTRGRAYRGRYKALTVAEAVTVSYLAFGFIAYILEGLIQIARAAIIVSWILTVCFLVTARVWVTLWNKAMKIEQRFMALPPHERAIETVLVIGGDGYIGSALLPKLLTRGYRVRVLSLFLYGTDSISGLLNHPRLEMMHADFRQIDKVVEAMRDIDAVVHLGAIVGDPACALDEDLTIDVNVMATRMIAEVAKGHGVNRFIFASTCSVYGASNEILDENSALVPVSLYARSKIACERILGSMADEKFAPVFLRFGTVYGLSGRTRFDLVVNLLTARAVVDGEFTVTGEEQWRPFIHVDDAASAVMTALHARWAVVHNQTFNVGSDTQNYTIGQVGRMIHAAVPSARMIVRSDEGDRRNYQVSFSKISSQLGFAPAWTLEQGITQVIQAIREGKVGDYHDPKYSNVKFLSEEGVTRLAQPRPDWVRDLLSDPMALPVTPS